MTEISIQYKGVEIMDGLKVLNPMTQNKRMIIEISPVLLLTFLQRRRQTLKEMKNQSPELEKWCENEILSSYNIERQITKIHTAKIEE